MKLAIGCDHAGFELKELFKNSLMHQGYIVEDYGTYDDSSCDYPDYAWKVAQAVSRGDSERGIIVCGSGIGVSIVANKVQGIRAALCNDIFTARSSREHNDANVLCIGARVVGKGVAETILDEWIHMEFSGGRHQKRVDKIHAYEKNVIDSLGNKD